jgi:hypothetical protein
MRQALKPIGTRPAEALPPIMMAGWLGERLKRSVGRVWHKMRSPIVAAQSKRLPSVEQMEALRAKFAKDEPRKEQPAGNGRARMRA